MPSLSGINLSLNALLAHSQAMEVIEHNVANANTAGYHRQEAVLRTTTPANLSAMDNWIGGGMRGTGVEVASIKRFNLEFFDTRFRSTTSEATESNTKSGVLGQLEISLAETGADGLLVKMDAFWSSWQQLSADPSNTSLRAKLMDESSALVQSFNRRANQMMALRTDQNLMVSQRVEEINSASQRIAGLNAEISRVISVGEQPNDLLDERDRLLDRLSEIAGATSHIQDNGEVIVSISGHMLVTGHNALKLQTVADLANDNLLRVEWQVSGQSFQANHGELAGLIDVRDKIIPAQQQGLDDLAAELMDQVNSIHRTGFGLDGTTTLDFFTGTDALSMRLNSALTLENIAASSINNSPGQGDLAMQISELQHSKVMNGGTVTLNGFYNKQITQLGLEVQRAQIDAHNKGLVQSALGQQRESTAGVNLDEEAANLAKYQRAYQAAARVMTVYDEMLERIINGLGVGGR